MEKMTNAKALNFVIANCEVPSEVKEKLVKMLAQVEKKNGAEKKPTATQKENVGVKSAILEGMVEGKAYTITEMIKTIPSLAEMSNQKVSALVRQLKEENLVTRSEEKGKALFTKC